MMVNGALLETSNGKDKVSPHTITGCVVTGSVIKRWGVRKICRTMKLCFTTRPVGGVQNPHDKRDVRARVCWWKRQRCGTKSACWRFHTNFNNFEMVWGPMGGLKGFKVISNVSYFVTFSRSWRSPGLVLFCEKLYDCKLHVWAGCAKTKKKDHFLLNNWSSRKCIKSGSLRLSWTLVKAI